MTALSKIRWDYLLLASCLLAILFEPALAGNKFETIGSGVSGQVHVKKEYLFIIFLAVGGLLAVFGLLALFMPKDNAGMMNYTLGKQSAVVFFILSIASFVGAYFI